MRFSSQHCLPRYGPWLFLLLLLCFPVQGQEQDHNTSAANAATDVDVCPVYRELDVDSPNSIQYNAPDGCRCVDGMSDLNCGYCDGDAPCQKVDEGHVCRSGLIFSEGDTYKSYKCALAGTIEHFFKGGKISVYANVLEKEVNVSIYNTPTVNDIHAIDCHLTGCDFTVGSNRMYCDWVVCECPHCDATTKQIVENMVSGAPADMITEENELGFNHKVAIKVNGAPVDIEAVCNATGCSLNPEAQLDETLLFDKETEWRSSATFSLMVLSILFGMALVLSVCIFVPYIFAVLKGRRSVVAHRNLYEYDNACSKHVLEFRNITRVVQLKSDAAKAHGQKEKTILHNISGSVESGTLMGIMGPSGAGKSSLLNILAAVDNGRARNSGQVLLNGKLQKQGYRKKVAYVQQDDTLYGTLTVQECVEYSAMLRLPKSMPHAEKQGQVWKTLQELRLTEIATNRIGTGGANAGVSGGERKRVSIGMELVAHPAVLFLDEPSSGLDSHAANQIMKVLHELASRNRIVILSIHQPSMKSFLTMDKILLLGSGRAMYCGKPSEVGRFLEDRGFPCPELETVADHMLDVVSDKTNHATLTGPPSPRRRQPQAPTTPTTTISTAADNAGFPLVEDPYPRPSKAEPRSIVNEMVVLFGRTSKDIIRNRELFLMQLGLCTVLACFVGAIFSDVSNNLAGFQNRMGAFYFSLSFFAFASFSSMDIFVKERHIFMRETGSKYHRVISYFITKTVLDTFVLRIIPATVFVIIFYWLMGLKSEPECFVVFWATLVLFNVCAGVMSICISIATPTVGQANLIASVWFLIMLLFGGFLVNVDTMAPWFGWLRFLSIFYYSFEILMTNELEGLLLSFDAPGYPSIPVYGDVFLATIGMKVEHQTRDLVCMCGLALGFSAVAYLLLLLRVPISAGTHFRRMENENKRLSRASEKLETAIDDSNKEGFVEEDFTRPDSPPHIAVTQLHAGSAGSFWFDIPVTTTRSQGSATLELANSRSGEFP